MSALCSHTDDPSFNTSEHSQTTNFGQHLCLTVFDPELSGTRFVCVFVCVYYCSTYYYLCVCLLLQYLLQSCSRGEMCRRLNEIKTQYKQFFQYQTDSSHVGPGTGPVAGLTADGLKPTSLKPPAQRARVRNGRTRAVSLHARLPSRFNRRRGPGG
jgi:hypothetical protein